MTAHTRLNWEFYAVLEGCCAPVLPGEVEPSLQSRKLWVFPPGTAHGWRGEKGAPCSIVCFHFAFVPSPLQETALEQHYHAGDLSATQAGRLSVLAQELRAHFEQPTNFSHVIFHRALIELTLMAAANIPETPLPELATTAQSRVDAAIAYYLEHLAEGPRIEPLAKHLGVSVSGLRQMFMTHLRESPQAVFKQIRLRRAMELLSETNLKLEAIAQQCGYSNASDFSRAFRNEFKISPAEWRANDYRTVPGALLKRSWLGKQTWEAKKPFGVGGRA